MEAEKPAGKRPRTKYNAAFRTEAVRRVNQNGQLAARVAQALGMSEAVLGKGVRAARDLFPFTGPVESRASDVLKLDRSGGSYYLIGR